MSGRGPELSTEVTERTSFAPRGLTVWRWLTNMQMGPPTGSRGSLLLLQAQGPNVGTVGSRSQSSDCLESGPLSSEESCTDTCLFSVAMFFVV